MTNILSANHRGLGKTVVESYNFLTKINSKYQISDKLGDTVSKAVDSAASESGFFPFLSFHKKVES